MSAFTTLIPRHQNYAKVEEVIRSGEEIASPAANTKESVLYNSGTQTALPNWKVRL